MASDRIGGWIPVDRTTAGKARGSDRIYLEMDKVDWKKHPINEKVDLGFLITKKEDRLDFTCIVAKVPRGQTIPQHHHEVQDVIVPLCGKGKFWIEGQGEFEFKKGVVLNIPPGVAHRLYDVTEDIEIFDVYIPSIM